ncbi:hypothetical protein [Bradyrhizobium symbiodeficiens]|uniref:hypothetical protein n=1 Tax=Bradyrhizobium symbiodeficiens TaxID=1404367 RepID=UPI00140F80F5|nr:hypothetical protein [Bradyrhizobium symbiodeficiens]QIO98833.1 hypothetical protein HAU86_02985 [Bradyrhizobium symbiodeficiens]
MINARDIVGVGEVIAPDLSRFTRGGQPFTLSKQKPAVKNLLRRKLGEKDPGEICSQPK